MPSARPAAEWWAAVLRGPPLSCGLRAQRRLAWNVDTPAPQPAPPCEQHCALERAVPAPQLGAATAHTRTTQPAGTVVHQVQACVGIGRLVRVISTSCMAVQPQQQLLPAYSPAKLRWAYLVGVSGDVS